MRSDLERFFSPKSVALIGASQDLITISGQPLAHLINHGYSGKLYPVNPRYQEILGQKCYPSIAELPETPDLALILINAARVADMLEQCGKKGVPYVVIFSSGFSETGAEGVALQQRLTDVLKKHALDFDLSWVIGGLPFLTTPGTLVMAVQEAIRSQTGIETQLSTTGGTSDGRFIAQICPQVIELGPPNASIHKIDEHVAIVDLEPLKEIYKQVLVKLNQACLSESEALR